MAISRKRKTELVNQYVNWLDKSQALFLTEYTGLSMKQIDDLRSKVREVGVCPVVLVHPLIVRARGSNARKGVSNMPPAISSTPPTQQQAKDAFKPYPHIILICGVCGHTGLQKTKYAWVFHCPNCKVDRQLHEITYQEQD